MGVGPLLSLLFCYFCGRGMVRVWRSKDKLQVILSDRHVGPGDRSQGLRFLSTCIYLLSHPASPLLAVLMLFVCLRRSPEWPQTHDTAEEDLSFLSLRPQLSEWWHHWQIFFLKVLFPPKAGFHCSTG